MDINKEIIDFRFDAIIFLDLCTICHFLKNYLRKSIQWLKKKSSLIICEPVRKNFQIYHLFLLQY